MDPATHRGPRIAFFGGSFDPPHLGHLAVARAARAALGLDTVLFAPVGTQPLKPQGSSASFAHRLAMTQLAIDSEPGFALSLADAPKPSGAPNYTLETLTSLRAELPSGSAGALFCLMGADSFAQLRRWHRAAEIPFVAPLIIASRPNEDIDDLKAFLPEGLSIDPAPVSAPSSASIVLCSYILRNPAGDSAPFYLLPELEVEISASQIREQLRIREQASALEANWEGERKLLPEPVFNYIRSHKLYL